MNENFDEIEKRIIKELEDFLAEVDAGSNRYRGDRSWTNRIKEKIGQLGLELQHKVAIGGFPDMHESEWLYDIVWYDEDTERRLVRVPLIVESEWHENYA